MMNQPVFKTIEQRWEDLAVAVLPKDVPKIQRMEMKKAFYAGFVSALSIMCYEIVDMEDDAAIEQVTNLWSEAGATIGNIEWLFSLYNDGGDTIN